MGNTVLPSGMIGPGKANSFAVPNCMNTNDATILSVLKRYGVNLRQCVSTADLWGAQPRHPSRRALILVQ